MKKPIKARLTIAHQKLDAERKKREDTENAPKSLMKSGGAATTTARTTLRTN